MNLIIALVKTILVRMATKYAAELIFNHLLSALSKAAENTETTIDDDIVKVVLQEKEFIIDSVNGTIRS